MTSAKPLNIAINAQINRGRGTGGVESVVSGLIHALGQLTDGNEQYTIVGPYEQPGWLEEYLGPNQKLMRPMRNMSIEPAHPSAGERFKRALGPLRPVAHKVWRGIKPKPRHSIKEHQQHRSPLFSNLDCDVIHFPFQQSYRCAAPTIFNPHDLQHLHYPDYFTEDQIAAREKAYRFGCGDAKRIAVASDWIKNDIAQQYRIQPEKIQVIPWAPPTQAYQQPTETELEKIKLTYGLDRPFAYYPAMTWVHKNHVRLIEALGRARQRTDEIPMLVCTGKCFDETWPSIEAAINEQGLNDMVKFLDVVPTSHVRALYRLARFVVVPTLFEAASGPVFEAWHENVPVTCSNVTSLPQQTQGAALLFDPNSTSAIADAVVRMNNDPALRDDLVAKGAARLGQFSWERTAKAYRALYRNVAGYPLNDEDRSLLQWDWMRDPPAMSQTAT